jgi:galactonate dehydratase
MSVSRRKAIAGIFAASGMAVKTEEQIAHAQQVAKNAPIKAGEPLKITKLETILVKPRWLFLKIYTNAGIVGYGEPITEGRALTCAAAVKEVEPYLVGKDPRPVQQHWQAIYRHAFYRGGPILTSALSGIDQALWDIKGKALGIPVYEFFGGPTRNRIRVYAHAGTPDAMKAQMARGFNAFKTGPASPRRGASGRMWARYVESPADVDYAIERFAELRKTVGDKADIGVDFHGRISPALAKILIKKLEPYNPMFIEEPCQAQNHDIMAEIARGTHCRLLRVSACSRSGDSAKCWRRRRRRSYSPICAMRGYQRGSDYRGNGGGVLCRDCSSQPAGADFAGVRSAAGGVDQQLPDSGAGLSR